MTYTPLDALWLLTVLRTVRRNSQEHFPHTYTGLWPELRIKPAFVGTMRLECICTIPTPSDIYIANISTHGACVMLCFTYYCPANDQPVTGLFVYRRTDLFDSGQVADAPMKIEASVQHEIIDTRLKHSRREERRILVNRQYAWSQVRNRSSNTAWIGWIWTEGEVCLLVD